MPRAITPRTRGPKAARGEPARHRYEVWLTDAERAALEAIHGAVTAGLIRRLALAGRPAED